MPMAVISGGTDTSVLRCAFNYMEYDINASDAPVGLTVFDNNSPINGGLRCRETQPPPQHVKAN